MVVPPWSVSGWSVLSGSRRSGRWGEMEARGEPRPWGEWRLVEPEEVEGEGRPPGEEEEPWEVQRHLVE